MKNADLCALTTLAGMEQVMRGPNDQLDAIREMSWTMPKLAVQKDLEYRITVSGAISLAYEGEGVIYSTEDPNDKPIMQK